MKSTNNNSKFKIPYLSSGLIGVGVVTGILASVISLSGTADAMTNSDVDENDNNTSSVTSSSESDIDYSKFGSFYDGQYIERAVDKADELATLEVDVAEITEGMDVVVDETANSSSGFGEQYNDMSVAVDEIANSGSNELYEASEVYMDVPNWDVNCNSWFKSYMPYTAVTDTSSSQYELLNGSDAYTDINTGIRMVGDRYCIALGSYYTTEIGQKVDLVLDNGNVIKCVLGDCKADCDTNASNQYAGSGDVAEFIVDYNIFNNLKDASGTVNWVYGFEGDIVNVVLVG